MNGALFGVNLANLVNNLKWCYKLDRRLKELFQNMQFFLNKNCYIAK